MAFSTPLRRIIVLVTLATLMAMANGKVFRKCEFAQLLERQYGLPRSEIKNWVCIAEFESSFNTEAMNSNSNGSKDYGIFQINNKWWCTDGFSNKNGCGMDCSRLLGSDITNSLRCAQTVLRQQGYIAWVAYKNKCRNRNLDQYMAECWGQDF